MNEMKPISNFKNSLYQVAIILLLAYAAYSSAMKDLDRLLQVAGNVHTATSSGLGSLARVYSATQSWAADAELAHAPENSFTESRRIDIIAAGGSVALGGFDRDLATEVTDDRFVAVERRHNKLACPVRKRDLPKAVENDFKWDVVAQLPRRSEVLRYQFAAEPDAEIAPASRKGPRIRAIINKLPAKAGKERWTNVGEFKSLSEVFGFGLKAARTEAAEIEHRSESTEEPSHYRFEFKRGVSDSERDDLATHE